MSEIESTRDRARRDPVIQAEMANIAAAFQHLAALAGVQAVITVKDGAYFAACGLGGEVPAEETDCGGSVHGLYDWLKRQPGYKEHTPP